MAHAHTKHCSKCSRDIRVNNFARHIQACSGLRIKKIRGIDFDPNAGYKDGSRSAWNKGLDKEHNRSLAKAAETLRKRYGVGELKPVGCCSREWLASDNHVESSRRGGGYRENAGRSKKFFVEDSLGNKVCLQSTYELQTCEILNELGFKWVRPKALKYDGKNYFADFYLPEFDLWLDPKNDFKAKQDQEKIQKVIEQNGIKLVVLLKHQITKQHIASLV
jgi:hypothetical protein